MTRMLIVGPPGSGKGTQAERISERLQVVAISTGDIFRDNVKGLTSLGLEAKKYLDAGDFVPDGITNKMVRERLGEPDVEHGFLLDGYPRTWPGGIPGPYTRQGHAKTGCRTAAYH